jgi:battenin
VVKWTAPFWVHRLSYATRVVLCGVFGVVAFYTVGGFHVLGLRLLGVVFASVASGWGEITCLALTSFYDRTTVTAWSSGTGFAGIAGAGWYLLLHSVLGLTPQLTLFLGGLWPVLYVVTYRFLLLPPPPLGAPEGEKGVEIAQVAVQSTADGGAAVADRPTEADDATAALLGGVDASSAGRGGAAAPVAGVGAVTQSMSAAQRLSMIASLYRFIVPLSTVYFAEYAINTGVNSTLAFPSMSKTKFYVVAGFVYQVGVFLSRSSGTWLPLRRLWPLPVLQTINLGLFIGQALGGWLSSPYAVLVFVLWVGLLGGACYVNTYRLIRVEVAPELQEFSLGAASISDTLGILVAAGVSIALESALDKHGREPG